MFIKIGENEYELSTKLGTAVSIERRFKIPIIQLFGKLQEALTEELAAIVAIAANKLSDKAFNDALMAEWDLLDLYTLVQQLIARLMFSGTPEQNEVKMLKFPADENQKNALRELLGMPLPTTALSTGDS